ncbi:hypothetical protein [Nocardia carnea]|uniref:ESX-1 secretion-associated protein EspA/EspE-like domain-containing protein n=1 Tax=Nocardia carnea TaxID=37328 RepID=A0ABW7TP13_9NOCA|nr:hypothetical protein [Nocardia carnea]
MAGDDPWGAFRDRAASGGVAFEYGVAKDAATFCADLMSVFDVVEEVAPLLVPLPKIGLESFAGPERLRAKLDEVATEFENDILPKHRQHVRDLGEAFVLAGNLYRDTDQDAAGRFQSMVDSSGLGEQVEHAFAHYDDTDGWVDETYKYRPDLGRYGDENNKYTLPAGLTGLEGVQAFGAEAPPAGGLNFNQFWMLGDILTLNGWSVEDKATYWYRIRDQLDRGFNHFDQGMLSLLESDRWKGQGSDGAATAVRAYLGSGEKLISATGTLALNLVNMSAWLVHTSYGMPDKSVYYTELESGQGAVNVQEELAAQVYANFYEPGVKLASSVIPTLPVPNGQPDLPNDNGGNNNGGNNNGGGNNGGGNNGAGGGQPPGQSAQQQQQQAVGEIAQQRAELLAAQKELEQQAQQQQQALQQQQQALQQQAGAQPMLQAAQQGLQQLGQLGQQLSTAAQQALQQAGITGLPGMPALQDAVKNYQSALQKAGKLPAGLGGAGGGPGGSSPAGTKTPPVPNMEKASKLFPRATVATGVAAGQATGVVAASQPGAPMGGMPMGGGGAGGGAQGGQQKDHKRADYLDSTEWLEEGIGDPSIVAKPVVDQ